MKQYAQSGVQPVKKRIKEAAAGIAAVSVMYLFFHIIGIGCPIRWFTGIPCAGCGMTRAYAALLAGDIAKAFAYHPLFWTVPAVAGVWLLCRMRALSEGVFKKILYGTAVLFLVVYVYRLCSPNDTVISPHISKGVFYTLLRAVWKH